VKVEPSLPVVDVETPNAARMYDYHLGGSHNFAVDRAAAERTKAVMPWLVDAIRANRGFLARAVRFCQRQGVTQFLDLGSGIPTVGSVHEVARATERSARVAYVDNEPVAAVCAEALLADDPLATITRADLRDHDAVFGAPGVARLLDFSLPVALLTVMVLHAIPDSDDPAAIVAEYRRRLAPGSFHVLSHITSDHDPDVAARAATTYQPTGTPVTVRSRVQVAQMLDGVTLVDPGLVDATEWRHDDPGAPEHVGLYAAVGRLG
jgi:SAM-dependent methyltransferase